MALIQDGARDGGPECTQWRSRRAGCIGAEPEGMLRTTIAVIWNSAVGLPSGEDDGNKDPPLPPSLLYSRNFRLA